MIQFLYIEFTSFFQAFYLQARWNKNCYIAGQKICHFILYQTLEQASIKQLSSSLRARCDILWQLAHTGTAAVHSKVWIEKKSYSYFHFLEIEPGAYCLKKYITAYYFSNTHDWSSRLVNVKSLTYI